MHIIDANARTQGTAGAGNYSATITLEMSGLHPEVNLDAVFTLLKHDPTVKQCLVEEQVISVSGTFNSLDGMYYLIVAMLRIEGFISHHLAAPTLMHVDPSKVMAAV